MSGVVSKGAISKPHEGRLAYKDGHTKGFSTGTISEMSPSLFTRVLIHHLLGNQVEGERGRICEDECYQELGVD